MNLFGLLRGKRKSANEDSLSEFYSVIARWNDIYEGGGDWRYARKGGINGGGMRRTASLGAAKIICSELSRLCFTEGAQVSSADRQTEEFLKKVLEENNFAQRFSDFAEKMFALGGGVIKVYYDDGIKLDFITADRFVPTKWDSGGIYGGAFGSRVAVGGKNYILAETQEMTDEGLKIENRLFFDGGAVGREVCAEEIFPKLCEKSVIKGLTRPLFVYFRAGSGGAAACPELGTSVFADCIDTLKSLDVVFDSLSREFILGKKRIIVPSYALRGEYDDNGVLKHYFDVNDEVFESFSASDNDELKIQDNTAQLRVEEHNQALGELLELLCMQTGLSEGTLSYKNGTIRTAAEVISRDSKTFRTANFYRRNIAAGLARVMENICLLGKMAGTLSESASETAVIRFADGVYEDDASKTERAKALFSGGLISRARALSEIYGIPLEQAKAMEKEDFGDHE